MKRKSSLLLTFISLLLLGTLFIGGCATSAKKPAPNVPTPTTPTPITPAPAPAPTPAPTTPVAPAYNTELANKVAAEADKVSGVQKSNVLIVDKNIYIGLDLKANMDKTKSDNTEKAVTNKIKSMEPDYNVVVSSDADLVTRIKNVANGIAAGKPWSSFQSEIELIGNRINPQKK